MTVAGGTDCKFTQVSNRFIVIKDLSGDKYPELKLVENKPSIILHGYKTLKEIESELKYNGHVQKSADFFAPDGSRYASSS